MRSKQKRIKTSHRLSSTDQTGALQSCTAALTAWNAGMLESSRIGLLDFAASSSQISRIAAVPVKMT